MLARLMRALALSMVVLLGWSGVAAAQGPAGNYDFMFSTAGGTSGSGVITLDGGRHVTGISNFFIGVTQYYLDQNFSGVGTSPQLALVTSTPYFYSTQATSLFVSNTGTGNTGYDFRLATLNGTTADSLYTYAAGAQAASETLASESLTLITPVPTPGVGLASWLIAALGLGGYGAWTQLRRRRETEALA